MLRSSSIEGALQDYDKATRSAVAAAAYRSASAFTDQRQGQSFDYSDKSGVIHSEILLPEGAPEWMRDREQLWNAAEAAEQRRDAQVAREVEFALPEELKDFEAIELVREFVEREFVTRGMVADLNVHWDEGNPHAHVMLTMREVMAEGFGQKVREWNQASLLREWREHWADLTNQHLMRAGYDIHVDHRSLRDQGIELEPISHLGKAVDEMRERGEYAERARRLEEVRERHLAYVAMTRHREGVDVYAGRDDFKGVDELKERLSRARPKDSTLDYAQRRGMETARA